LFPDIGLDDMRMLGGNASDILQKFQTESRQLIDILQARHFIHPNSKFQIFGDVFVPTGSGVIFTRFGFNISNYSGSKCYPSYFSRRYM
jgi:hypothetical protein